MKSRHYTLVSFLNDEDIENFLGIFHDLVFFPGSNCKVEASMMDQPTILVKLAGAPKYVNNAQIKSLFWRWVKVLSVVMELLENGDVDGY